MDIIPGKDKGKKLGDRRHRFSEAHIYDLHADKLCRPISLNNQTVKGSSEFTGDLTFSGDISFTGDVVFSDLVVNDLTDVIITTPADNELLAYDLATTNWINQTAAEAGLSVAGHTHALDDLSDVAETGVAEYDHVGYTGAGWENVSSMQKVSKNAISETLYRANFRLNWKAGYGAVKGFLVTATDADVSDVETTFVAYDVDVIQSNNAENTEFSAFKVSNAIFAATAKNTIAFHVAGGMSATGYALKVDTDGVIPVYSLSTAESYLAGNLALASGKSLIFDGSGGNDYIKYASNQIQTYIGGVKQGGWYSSGLFVESGKYVAFNSSNYRIQYGSSSVDIYANSNKVAAFDTNKLTLSGDLYISEDKKVYLDGGTNDYIWYSTNSSSLSIVFGGSEVLGFYALATTLFFGGTVKATLDNLRFKVWNSCRLNANIGEITTDLIAGDLWYDENDNLYKYFDGTNTKVIATV